MSPSILEVRDEALRKPDLTGLIADAQGVYHDLTKGAFDAFSLKHPHQVVEDISDALLEQPLFKGIAAIAKEAGVDLSKFGEMDPAGVAANLAQYLGSKAKGLTAAGVAEAGAYFAGSNLATGGAAAIGLAVEAAIEWAVTSFTRDKQEHYMRGDWVTVDHGEKTVKVVDPVMDFATAGGFEDTMDLSELHILQRVDDYHVGFFVSFGVEQSTINVFDILTGKVERHIVTDVALLPQANRVALDNDAVASKIRELFFMKRDHIHYDAKVSSDPGTEVIHDGALYNIVHTDMDVALIEDQAGERKHVTISTLDRSRQERVGPTYIYKQGLPKPNTSFVTTPGGFGTGDWIWYEVGNEYWELAVVHIINGPDVVVYSTIQGTRRVLEEDQVRVASRDDSDTFNRMRNFALFKVAAVQGEEYNTLRLKCPAKYYPLVYRKGPKARYEPERKAAAVPLFRLNQAEEPVETGDRARRVDDAVEVQLRHGGEQGAVAYEDVANEEAECRRRLMEGGGDASLCRTRPEMFGSRPKRRRVEKTVTFEPSVLLIGAAVVAAFIYFR